MRIGDLCRIAETASVGVGGKGWEMLPALLDGESRHHTRIQSRMRKICAQVQIE